MMSTRIDMAAALTAAQGATAQAAEIGKPIAITVVDAGGYVIPQHRNDGVRTAATTVSAAKARASVLCSSGRPPTSRRLGVGHRLFDGSTGEAH